MVLRVFGAHVAVAIENARLFEQERAYASMLETLGEIGREFGAILDLEQLLMRIASLLRRVIDYRTFGILLLNEGTQELEIKVAVKYGDQATQTRVKVGEGLGYAPCKRNRCSCRTSQSTPLHQIVEGARSGSPFRCSSRNVASVCSTQAQAGTSTRATSDADPAREPGSRGDRKRAAREEIRRNEVRRRGSALALSGCATLEPRKFKSIHVAARFAARAGRGSYDFLSPKRCAW